MWTTTIATTGVLTLWCAIGVPRVPMPVSGDSLSGETTHSRTGRLLVNWATHHVLCGALETIPCLTVCPAFSDLLTHWCLVPWLQPLVSREHTIVGAGPCRFRERNL